MTAVTKMIVEASDDVDTQFESNDNSVSKIELGQTGEEHLNFSEHFQALMLKQDYSFARQLLEVTYENNEIDISRYNCERLQILNSENDRDGFYRLYSEIEAEIPSYDLGIRSRILQMLEAIS